MPCYPHPAGDGIPYRGKDDATYAGVYLGLVHRHTRAVSRHGAHLKALGQAILALSPAFLVFQLILMQGGGLLDAVRNAELHRLLGGLLPHVIPRRAKGELIGDRPNAAGVDVAAQRHTRDDGPGPVRGLPIQRHRQNMQGMAAAAITWDHWSGGPWRRQLAWSGPITLSEGQHHRVIFATVDEPTFGRDVVQTLG